MTAINPDPINMAVARLLEDIEILSASAEGYAPEKMERMARALSAQLKAIAEIETHNRRIVQQDEEKNYLAYEDLPPPSPEDRDRILARVRLLYDRVTAGDDVSDISANPASPSAGASG